MILRSSGPLAVKDACTCQKAGCVSETRVQRSKGFHVESESDEEHLPIGFSDEAWKGAGQAFDATLCSWLTVDESDEPRRLYS
jgi:hypothetical protein